MPEKTPIGHYYHSKLEKQVRTPFREMVIKNTGVHFTTFYHWMNGVTEPGLAQKTCIVDALNHFLPDSECVTAADLIFGAHTTPAEK